MPNTRASNEGDMQQRAGQAIQEWQEETMPPPQLSQEDLRQLERQLIPLLNTVRKLLGKGPVET